VLVENLYALQCGSQNSHHVLNLVFTQSVVVLFLVQVDSCSMNSANVILGIDHHRPMDILTRVTELLPT
jgi:hypothetical protein